MTILVVVTFVLWIFPLTLQAAIVFAMVQRGLNKNFPIFFSYTLCVLCSETGLLFFIHSGSTYLRLYSCKEALAIVLGFAAIFEVLRSILPRDTSPRFVVNLVWVLAGLFTIAALAMFFFAKPSTGTYSTYDMVSLAERSVRFAQASLLMVVIALMSVLGLTWQHESVGILLGFGLYSAVALVGFEFASKHWISLVAFSILNSAAYNVAVLIWAFYILRPRRRKPLGRLPNADLTEWNDALNNFVDQRSRRP